MEEIDLVKTHTFYSKFILPSITKFEKQRIISGKYALHDFSKDNYCKSTFLLLKSWEIEIKLRFNKKIDYFILSANCTSSNKELYHAFHFHPDIEETSAWSCTAEYEKGPHIHLYAREESKLICNTNDFNIINLEQFLLFIIGRHHKERYVHSIKTIGKSINSVFGIEAAILGKNC